MGIRFIDEEPKTSSIRFLDEPEQAVETTQDTLIALPEGVSMKQIQQRRQKAVEGARGRPGIVNLGPLSQMATGVRDVQTRMAGNVFETEETRTLPRFNQLNVGIGKDIARGLATMTASSPEELVQMTMSIDPGATFRYDDMGNIIGKTSAGEEGVLNPPGMDFTDVLKMGAEIAKFAPSGRAATITGRVLGTAGTAAISEGVSAGLGGEFEPEQVALETGLSLAGEVISPALRGARSPVEAAQESVEFAGRQVPDTAIPPGAGAGPVTRTIPVEPTQRGLVQQPQQAVTQEQAEQVVGATRKAAESRLGRSRAMQILSEEVAPNPEIIESAKLLGIEQHLQPDHVTTNQAFREVAQALKSIPASRARTGEIATFQQVGQRASDLIEEIGGINDLSLLDQVTKTRIQASRDGMKKVADDVFAGIRKEVDESMEVDASSVLDWIGSRAARRRDGIKSLTSLEKMINSRLAPKDRKLPTYADLDDVRKLLTRERVARQETKQFKDADTWLIENLERRLMDDQRLILESVGQKQAFDLGRNYSRMQKSFENDLKSLYGKQIDQSLVAPLMTAVRALPKGDASKFVKLLKSIPAEDRKEFTASALRVAFGNTKGGRHINFNDFANFYEGLQKNSQAFNAFMANIPPESRKKIKALYDVSNGIRLASRERIPTGRIEAIRGQFEEGADGLISNIYQTAKRSLPTATAAAGGAAVGGGPGAALATATVSALTKNKAPVMEAADNLIASPEFLKAVTTQSNRSIDTLAKSSPFKKFWALAEGPKETISDPKEWIRSALRAVKVSEESQPNTESQ